MSFQIAILLLLLLSTVHASCPDNPAFARFTVGSVNGTVVSDGPGIFTVNFFSVPDAAVERSYAASFRKTNPTVLQQNVVILDTPEARIMVDAGSVDIPEFPFFSSAGRLLKNLKAAGIPPSSIDAVIFTHAHPDHVAGIKNLDGGAAFPNAKLYVGEKEHTFWTTLPVPNPKPEIIPNETMALISEIYLRSIAPYKNRIVLVPEGASPFRGVKFVPSPGHSPGHVAVRISSKKERLLITGDSWVSKPDHLENPEWAFFIESNENQAYETRIRLLSRVSRRRDLVLSYHEAFPGLGYVSENGAAFSWTPAEVGSMGTGVETKCSATNLVNP